MVVNSFQKLQKIGEGTYGVVYKAQNKNTGEIVALKKIRGESKQEGIPATTIREILILKNLKHPSIVDLQEVIHSGDKMYLVFEYVETDLRDLIDKYIIDEKVFAESVLKKMSYQLCSAIAYCHGRNIFHRDIKPQNILVSSDFDVKLGDFGLSRAVSVPLRQYTSEIVTLFYRAPEILLGCKYYDSAIDVWSLACIFYEMYSLNILFHGDSEIDQLYKIFSILGTPTKEIWPNLTSMPNFKSNFPTYESRSIKEYVKHNSLATLIEKMLQYDPEKRITAQKALFESFFKEILD